MLPSVPKLRIWIQVALSLWGFYQGHRLYYTSRSQGLDIAGKTMQHEFLKCISSPQPHQDQSKNKLICSGPESRVATLAPWNHPPSAVTK